MQIVQEYHTQTINLHLIEKVLNSTTFIIDTVYVNS